MKIFMIILSAFVVIRSVSYVIYCLKNKMRTSGLVMIILILSAVGLMCVKIA